MATTIQPPETEQKKSHLDAGKSGGGGLLHLGPVDATRKTEEDPSPAPVRTGIWIGLAAITMSFAAFTSAVVVRQSTANDWHHLVIPPIVFGNTLVLLASSVTLEVARRRVAVFPNGTAIAPTVARRAPARRARGRVRNRAPP